jgi:HAD superfamily hydrolase (TIGR01490 family)
MAIAHRLAFFDIDGTLFRSSLLIELVRELILRGAFPPEVESSFEDEYMAWARREGTYEAYIDAVVRTFIQHIKGVHYGVLADAGRDAVLRTERYTYRYTRSLIQSCKKDGCYLVAISQSPKAILDVFCTNYGFDKVYGRMYEIGAQDLLTGAVIDEHLIENKANIAKRVAEQTGISLQHALAVGDTEGDIPLLEIVGRSICFNPNKTLYTHARRMGWHVVVERKDVVYEF